MRVAVVGGGINGVMIGWELARQGCGVTLFERSGLMQETSRASSKMLHGGIRYLEHGHLRLVRESLQERAWWLAQAPELVKPFFLTIPVFAHRGRGKLMLGMGVKLYDWLARGSGFPGSRWLDESELVTRFPHIRRQELLGAWEFWDAQMDDYRLGLWAAEQARQAGVRIVPECPVSRVSVEGMVERPDGRESFDRVVNAAGPWARKLLDASGIASRFDLSLVRGSHLVVNRAVAGGCLLQRTDDARVVFLLPWGEHALLGTTEVEQAVPDGAAVADGEIDYLLETYNACFSDGLSRRDVISSFAGVRPIVRSGGNVSRASRESAVERKGRLISVFGGKWTSSRVLAKTVARVAMQ